MCVSIYFCLKRHHIPFINSHNYCTAVFVSFVCGVNICGFILVISWYFCFFFSDFCFFFWFYGLILVSVFPFLFMNAKKWKQHSIRSINFKTVIICQQKFSTINQRWESIVFQINFIPKSNQFFSTIKCNLLDRTVVYKPNISYSSLQAIKWALRQKTSSSLENELFARKRTLRQKMSTSPQNEHFVRKQALTSKS